MDHKNYVYFVSYSDGHGFGCCEVILTIPITTFDDVKYVGDLIKDGKLKDNLPCKNVAIIHWKILRSEP
jgi:hypothetical protein